MSVISQWKLRRLAGRSVHVLQRHLGKEPAIDVYQDSLAVSAQAFIAAYDKVHAHRSARTGAIGARSGAVDVLVKKLRGWAAMLGNDVAGFSRGSYGDNADVPEDVLDDAAQLLAVVDEHVATGGKAPAYFEVMKADLEPAIEAARGETIGAGVSTSTLAELMAVARAAAETFYADLVAFRRTLAAHLGRKHPDYTKLRSARASEADAEDDAVSQSLPDEGVVESGPEGESPLPAVDEDEGGPEAQDEDLEATG